MDDVADRYIVLAEVAEAQQALEILIADFASPEHLGSVRAARFAAGRRDAIRQADAFGFVQAFLKRVGGG